MTAQGALLAERGSEMSRLATYAAVLLVVVAALVASAGCADLGSAGCEHACCSPSDRGRLQTRLLRRVRALMAAVMPATGWMVGPNVGEAISLVPSPAAHGAPSEVPPLRI